MSAALVILAAGLGTRFKGGIKQLQAVGPNGELLIEYSINDAIMCGFDKIIFIIRHDIEKQFRKFAEEKFSNKGVEIAFCFQENEDLPEGFCPVERLKPWGTVHAVLAAEKEIDRPFLIINADDYYGKNIYKDIYNFLADKDRNSSCMCMGGFVLKNTISDCGTVTRGVCEGDENQNLVSVTETYQIYKKDGIISGERKNIRMNLDENSLVSMNMWGFDPSVMPQLKECFVEFLKENIGGENSAKCEYPLPLAVDKLISTGKISIKILPTHDKWYGMTQIEDLEEVKEYFKGLENEKNM